VKSEPGPPMTLGGAAAAGERLIVWVLELPAARVEPDSAELVERYGADFAVLEWEARLVCCGCGSHQGQHGRKRDRAAGSQSKAEIGIALSREVCRSWADPDKNESSRSFWRPIQALNNA
jgi:hypothetical protein